MTDHSSKIKLVAVDMDGTLFRGDLVISNVVRAAIARARAANVSVVLATGRMPAAARPFVKLLDLSGPQIYANGALVQDTDGEIIFHLAIDSTVAERAVTYCEAHSLHVNAYVGDSFYVARIGPEAEFTQKLNQIDPVEVPDLRTFVAQHSPTKLVVVRLPVVEGGLLASLQEEFRGDLFVSSSVPQYCEMINSLVDKGRALVALAATMGLTRDEIAAIGDGDNDLTLLAAAGFPIAMGNGTSRLKAIAHEIVGTVEEDGVAQAIDRYILCAG